MSMTHLRSIKRILRYLKRTVNYFFCYQGDNLWLDGYTDSDWADDLDGRKSKTGYSFLLNGGAILRVNKKQTCIAISIMEAEFATSTSAIQEAIRLYRFL